MATTTTTESILEDWFYSAGRAGDYATMHIWDGDGDASRVFEFNFTGGYLSTSHVKSFMVHTTSRTKVDLTLNWLGPNTATLSQAVPVGWQVTIYRDTPKDKPLASYIDGAVLNALNLERNSDQAMFAVSEMVDRFDVVVSTSEESLKVAYAANESATSSLETSKLANTKADSSVEVANTANAKADSAVATANDASTTAHGIDSKAQTALDNSKYAVSTADEAKKTADGIDYKAQTALDNSKSAVATADSAEVTAVDASKTANGIDAKATYAQEVAKVMDERAKHTRYLTDFTGSTEEERFMTAFAAVNAEGGTLYIPPGTYSFTGTATCPVDRGVEVRLATGATLQQTVDADMLVFNCASFGQISLSGSGQVWPMFSGKSASAAAVRINYGVVRIHDWTIWQSTKPGSFKYGFHLTDVQTPTIADLSINDDSTATHTYGMYICTKEHFSVDWSVTNVGTFGLYEAFRIEPYESASTTIEGFKLQHCYFVGCYRGVHWKATRHAPMLTLDTCHINTYMECVKVDYGLEIQVNNCVLYRYGDPSAPFIRLYNCQDVQVLGGKMSNTDGLAIPYISASGLTAFLRIAGVYFANNVSGSSLLKVAGDASKVYLDSTCVNGTGQRWLDLSEYTGPKHAIQVAPDLLASGYDAGVVAIPTVSISNNSVNLGTTAVGGFLRVVGSSGDVITSMTNTVPGVVYTIYFDTPGIVISHTASCLLSNDTSYTVRKAGESITFRGSVGGVREICRSNPSNVKVRGTVTMPALSLAAGEVKLAATINASSVTAGDVVDFTLVNNDRTDIRFTAYCVGGVIRLYAEAPNSGTRTLPATAVAYSVRTI